MATKGSLAKDAFIKTLINSLPEGAYIGEFEKKHYFWSEENGEKMQVAITLTCPKTQIEATPNVIPTVGNGMDFISMSEPVFAAKPSASKEISEQEKENIQTLMNKLGL